MGAKPTNRQLLLGWGHLTAVWTLAFVQPLLDLLGRTSEFFIARDNTPGDILILAIGFTLLPPAILFGLELIVSRISSRAYNWLHLTLLGGISVFFFIGILSGILPRPTLLLLAVAIGLAVLFARAAHRHRFVQNLLDLLILAPVIVLALFVFVSPAREAIFPGTDATLTKGDRGNDHPVVLVIFDELATGDLMANRTEIDSGRFPNFARLSREATWYRNQSTTSPFTPQAVPGILTGKSWPDNTLPTSWNMPDNVFNLLSTGRKLHVMENVTKLCPVSLCPQNRIRWRQLRRLKALWSDLRIVEGRLVLPPSLADRLPEVDGRFQGFDDNDGGGIAQPFRHLIANGGQGNSNVDLIRRFIRNIPAGNRGLTVMHLSLPHHVWRFTADGRLYNWKPQSEIGESSGKWIVDQAGIATAQARMYVQTGFADRLVGELRRTLKRKGLWDDSIVVVSADHGLSFEGGDVPRRLPSSEGMGEIANPPLFIKYPRQRQGRTVTAHSTTLDILPTITRALAVTPTYNFDGVPLQRKSLPERKVTLHGLSGPTISVSPQEMIRQRNSAIGRADARLGRGALYTLGPAPDLIGRRVRAVPAGTDRARLDAGRLWDQVRPGRLPVPVNVTGTLSTDLQVKVIAIAVNGVVQGTGPVFELEGESRFGTIVDPAVIRPGRNEIGIYAVSRGRLTPLGSNQR